MATSAAGAWTALARWRAKPSATKTLVVGEASSTTSSAPRSAVAVVNEPSTNTAGPARAPDGPNEEDRLYGAAHAAHFFGRDPAKALAAWNAYLRRYPRGTLAPEARYNRALALLRLGRTADAVNALRSFVDGPSGYRRAEAQALIEALTKP
ncbi:MAG TPA: tetratricopeptide repeat protein [Polyangia bacterium]|nr:tetratricopeptide repeat protein [Polyangia bacterium]